ncbi:unnamed protein product [Anisakis simplex]|uniref:Ammonium_transp domain-containing protein n=1 Tax=Anisakis simplex TaxID=6269 RepID=A0A0M3JXU6_ANISI|nr:unnamed protein product [Anisakis simplex]
MDQPKPKKFSIFTGLQFATTGAATLLMLRCFNRFISHAQRGRAIVGCAGCLYLSFANELGWFPFSLVAVGKTSTRNNQEAVREPIRT